MTEPRDTREKRLAMRSMRRGIKEMDLILPAYAAANLRAMTSEDLDLFEALLSENDHDIYGWIAGTIDVPGPYGALVARIAKAAVGVVRPA